MLYDSPEGWEGGVWEGVQEGGGICILTADSHGCTADTNATL